MDFALSQEQLSYQEKARTVASGFTDGALERDQREQFPMAHAQELARHGMMGVVANPQFGGSGFGTVEYALALHEVAQVCASTAVTMAVTNMTGEMIQKFGTPEQQERFLPRLNRGDKPVGSFCLSEPGSGSDAAALSATARLDGDNYVLNGSKAWVTSGAHCSVALVMARTSEHKSRGISAFLLEGDNPGYQPSRSEDKMGLRGSSTAGITLDDCVVPKSSLLGQEGDGFKVAMTALDGGRIGIGAQALGIAKAALKVAAQTVSTKGRVSQAARFRLADAATSIDAGWLMCMRAAHLRSKGVPMTRQAAMAKVFATESAGKAVELALMTMGAEGMLAQNHVERYARDVRVTRIYEGTSEIQRLVIAREILKGM